MKALIVPDLPEWKRKTGIMMKIMKPGDVILVPFVWGYGKLKVQAHRLGCSCTTHAHKRLKYIAIKKRAFQTKSSFHIPEVILNNNPF